MLTNLERELLSSLDHERILSDCRRIASFDRRSGREGEAKAVEFLTERLDRLKVNWTVHHYPVWLSDPVSCRLTCIDGESGTSIPCKTWSFCCSTEKPIRGRLTFLEADELERHPLNLLAARFASRARDLEGKIIVTRGASPVAAMDAGDRGAAALICVWPQGKETLIHEGNVNLIWGQPDPLESGFYPAIPILHLSAPAGKALIARVKCESVDVELEASVENACRSIPVVEAHLPGESEDYVLLGNHLDSWFYGACDNATGNAIALNMAELFAAGKLKRGLKICWWSGHSNGRYAGSAAFAAHNYNSLRDHCLALCNADMPGLESASDFGRCSSGPDLSGLYGSVVKDLTGQTLRQEGFVTGWDLSFKNIGVSSCMSWTSTLPDGAPQSTANSFMSWWWHTEADKMEHIDGKILEKDAAVYALTLNRLLAPEVYPFNNEALAAELNRRLARFEDTEDLRGLLKRAPLSEKNKLLCARILNRALFTFKASSQQDWAMALDYLPGLALAKSASPADNRGKLMIESFRRSQLNRLYELISELYALA